MNATDTRSELGARFDNVQLVDHATGFARAAGLGARLDHQHQALGAVFEALPGSTRGQRRRAADKLGTHRGGGGLHINANWTAIAKFDGEFAPTAQTYSGHRHAEI